MKFHIVLAHPEGRSFNGHLAAITQKTLSSDGKNCTLADLYAMDFDPREGAQHYGARADDAVFHAQTEQRFNAENGTIPADVSAEIEHILACDLLVVHFPLWWFGAPAILKGWMDRMFMYGRLYKSTMRYDAGLCRGKKMIACVTTGASAESCSHNGKEGDTHLHLWPLLFPFRYLGFNVLQPEVFHGVGGVSFIEGLDGATDAVTDYSNRWQKVLETIATRTSVPYNSDDDFDDTKRLRSGAPSFSPFIRQTP